MTSFITVSLWLFSLHSLSPTLLLGPFFPPLLPVTFQNLHVMFFPSFCLFAISLFVLLDNRCKPVEKKNLYLEGLKYKTLHDRFNQETSSYGFLWKLKQQPPANEHSNPPGSLLSQHQKNIPALLTTAVNCLRHFREEVHLDTDKRAAPVTRG